MSRLELTNMFPLSDSVITESKPHSCRPQIHESRAPSTLPPNRPGITSSKTTDVSPSGLAPFSAPRIPPSLPHLTTSRFSRYNVSNVPDMITQLSLARVAPSTPQASRTERLPARSTRQGMPHPHLQSPSQSAPLSSQTARRASDRSPVESDIDELESVTTSQAVAFESDTVPETSALVGTKRDALTEFVGDLSSGPVDHPAASSEGGSASSAPSHAASVGDKREVAPERIRSKEVEASDISEAAHMYRVESSVSPSTITSFSTSALAPTSGASSNSTRGTSEPEEKSNTDPYGIYEVAVSVFSQILQMRRSKSQQSEHYMLISLRMTIMMSRRIFTTT